MALRQIFQAHPFLDAMDIVFNTVPLPGVVGQVQDGVSSARVSVTRLTDRARVEDGAWSKGHLGDMLWHDQLGDDPGIRQMIKDGQVGMTHEAIGGIEEFKTNGGSAGVQQVFPYRAVGAAMHQGNEFEIYSLG